MSVRAANPPSASADSPWLSVGSRQASLDSTTEISSDFARPGSSIDFPAPPPPPIPPKRQTTTQMTTNGHLRLLAQQETPRVTSTAGASVGCTQTATIRETARIMSRKPSRVTARAIICSGMVSSQARVAPRANAEKHRSVPVTVGVTAPSPWLCIATTLAARHLVQRESRR
jgi:hypothetical protein